MDFFDEAPDEIIAEIFINLDFHDIIAAGQVCKRWRSLWSDSSLCSFIFKHYFFPDILETQLISENNNSNVNNNFNFNYNDNIDINNFNFNFLSKLNLENNLSNGKKEDENKIDWREILCKKIKLAEKYEKEEELKWLIEYCTINNLKTTLQRMRNRYSTEESQTFFDSQCWFIAFDIQRFDIMKCVLNLHCSPHSIFDNYNINHHNNNNSDRMVEDNNDGNIIMNEIVEDYLTIRKKNFVNTKNKKGFSALLSSCYFGYKDVIEWLLDNGANIEDKEPRYLQTPLMISVQRCPLNIVELILSKGADIRAVDRHRFTVNSLAKEFARDVLVRNFDFEKITK